MEGYQFFVFCFWIVVKPETMKMKVSMQWKQQCSSSNSLNSICRRGQFSRGITFPDKNKYQIMLNIINHFLVELIKRKRNKIWSKAWCCRSYHSSQYKLLASELGKSNDNNHKNIYHFETKGKGVDCCYCYSSSPGFLGILRSDEEEKLYSDTYFVSFSCPNLSERKHNC